MEVNQVKCHPLNHTASETRSDPFWAPPQDLHKYLTASKLSHCAQMSTPNASSTQGAELCVCVYVCMSICRRYPLLVEFLHTFRDTARKKGTAHSCYSGSAFTKTLKAKVILMQFGWTSRHVPQFGWARRQVPHDVNVKNLHSLSFLTCPSIQQQQHLPLSVQISSVRVPLILLPLVCILHPCPLVSPTQYC